MTFEQTVVTSKKILPVIIVAVFFSQQAFSQDKSRIQLDLPETTDFSIEIQDVNGRVISITKL